MSNRSFYSTFELLEARIAPASVVLYTDVDGDTVRVYSSKGNLAGHLTLEDAGAGQQLQILDLTDDSFAKANISVTVAKRAPTGDGSANVGFINAAGNDLGLVRVNGDLGRIVAGDANAGSPAINVLIARSMGLLGTSTQGGSTDGGSGELSPEAQDLLGQLAGAAGTPGLLSQLREQIAPVLANDDTLNTLPAEVVRTLSQLQSNLNAVDLAKAGGAGANIGLLRSLLDNIDREVDTLSEAQSGQDLFGHGLSDLLTTVQGEVNDLADELPASPAGTNLNELLNRPLIDLQGVHLPVLGGPIGGGHTAADSLQTLNTAVDNLLGRSEVNQLSPSAGRLLMETRSDLSDLLSGGPGLTGADGRTLAELQSNLAGLLGLAESNPDVFSPDFTEAVANVLDPLQDVLGGAGEGALDPAHSMRSDIRGNLTALRVALDVKDAFLNVQGNIGSAVIGGGLVGDRAINGGELFVTGNLGVLSIGKNLVGGDFANSGSVIVNGKTGVVAIYGSILGDEGAHSGSLTLHSDLRSLRLGGDLAGDGGVASGSVMNDNGGIGSFLMRGSIVAGDGEDAGTVRVKDALRSLRILGSVTGDAEHRVSIIAGGMENKRGALDVAIGSLLVNGGARFTNVLAGYDTAMGQANGDAQIGTVVIGKSWLASNLSAGVAPVTNQMDDFGESNNHVIPVNDSSIVAKIGRIIVRGDVAGTTGGGDDFGLVSEQIGSLTIRGAHLPLAAGAHNDVVALSRGTGDVTVREVSTIA